MKFQFNFRQAAPPPPLVHGQTETKFARNLSNPAGFVGPRAAPTLREGQAHLPARVDLPPARGPGPPRAAGRPGGQGRGAAGGGAEARAVGEKFVASLAGFWW